MNADLRSSAFIRVLLACENSHVFEVDLDQRGVAGSTRAHADDGRRRVAGGKGQLACEDGLVAWGLCPSKRRLRRRQVNGCARELLDDLPLCARRLPGTRVRVRAISHEL